ncbi:spermidine synthase [Ectothiorhodospiraceae bacterium 2226]|nr:spermidine synthase [Ectothiorhodospiraceae bacterium 2226]
MNPWILIDSAVPADGGPPLRLYRRGAEFSIKVGRIELMSSRVHGSEEALAQLACARLADPARAHVLVGGLGMGYTLAAALRLLGPAAHVTVAERAPAVVAWNRGPLAELAGRPLADPRVAVHEGDVAEALRPSERYDAILLDVDNGPEALSHADNQWLYGAAGLAAARAALRPAGVLAVWSVSPDTGFTRRLRQAGFAVEECPVRARGGRRGARHWIWLATRPA